MMTLKLAGCCLALAVPEPLLAQAAAPGSSDFARLWTGWSVANREAMRTEALGLQHVRQVVTTAGAERLRALRDQGRALGERVGVVVRLGDCEEGERMARQAGDFALVEAVRDHCRRAAD